MLANSSVRGGYPVVPSDSVNLVQGACNALYVGGAGDIAILDEMGQTVTYTGVAAGLWFPVKAVRVLAAGTTATGLVAGYY